MIEALSYEPDMFFDPRTPPYRLKDDGSYRLITDLSYPEGEFVNDFISKEDFSVQYSKLSLTLSGYVVVVA